MTRDYRSIGTNNVEVSGLREKANSKSALRIQFPTDLFSLLRSSL
jgi:hypothetical protein